MSNDLPVTQQLNSFGQTPPEAPAERQPTWSEIKQNRVDQASQTKQNFMGLGDSKTIATAVEEGNDLGNDALVQEMATGSLFDIGEKYGYEMQSRAIQLRNNMDETGRIRDEDRDFFRTMDDSLSEVASGAVLGIGGIAAFGTGLVSDEGGAAVSQWTNDQSERVLEDRSTVARDRSEQAEIRSSLDAEDIQRRYDEDIATGDNAGFNRLLSEIGRKTTDLIENPADAGTLVSQGVGSLIASGGVGGAASKGALALALRARGLTGAAATAYLGTAEGAALASTIAQRSTMGAIGALEGGGAYSQVQTEVQGMTEADLMSGSELYVSLREQDISHEDARDQVAGRAARVAGAGQSLVGILSGRLVAKLESNPLGMVSSPKGVAGALGSFGAAVGRETVEEGIQEGSSVLTTGASIQAIANEDKDITQGLGTSVVEGAVAGAGMAGVLRGPATAGRAATGTLAAAGRGIMGAAEGSATTREERAATEGGVNTDQTVQSLRDAEAEITAQATPTEAPTSDESTGNVDAVPLDFSDADTINSALAETAQVTAEEFNSLPASVARLVDDTGSVLEEGAGISIPRSTVIEKALLEIKEGKQSEEDVNNTSLWLYQQAKRYEAISQINTDAMPEGGRQAIEKIQGLVSGIISNPQIKKAMEKAYTTVSADLGAVPEITPANVSSPEVKTAASQQARLAESNPAGVDPKFVGEILNQVKAGKITLNSKEVKALQVASALLKSADKATAAKEVLDANTLKSYNMSPERAKKWSDKPTKNTEIVRGELTSGGKDGNQTKRPGLSRHVANIVSAVGSGNLGTAQDSFDSVIGFAESMVNKFAAARESEALGKIKDNKVPFRTWNGSTFVESKSERAGSIGINPNSVASMQLMYDVEIDAQTIIETAKALQEAYGDILKGDIPSITNPTNEANTAAKETTKVVVDEGLGISENESGQQAPDGLKPKVKSKKAKKTKDPKPVEPKNLVKNPDGESRVENSFNFDSTKSVLMSVVNPVKSVIASLTAWATVKGKLTNKVNVSAQQVKRINDYVKAYGPDMVTAMNARLNQKQDNLSVGSPKFNNQQKNLSPNEVLALKDTGIGRDITIQREMRAINLVNTETNEYDPQLLGAAVTAALHWVLNDAQNGGTLDREEVSKIFKVPEAKVTNGMMRLVNSGSNAQVSKESLARVIKEFWGVEQNNDVTKSDTDGITEALAAELLTVMENKLITVEPILIKGAEDLLSYQAGHTSSNEMLDAIGSERTMLAETFVPSAEAQKYIGNEATPPNPKRTQKNNKLGNISDMTLSAMKKEQQIEYRRNAPLLDLMNVFGKERVNRMRGFQKIDKSVTNVRHLQVIDGKNQTLERSWKMTMEHDEAVQAHAEIEGLDANDIPTKYAYNAVRNSRMMIKGFSPESDKLMRAAYNSTISTLDLSTRRDRDKFWLTVGQSSDLVKAEQGTRRKNAVKAEAEIRRLYGKSIDIMTDWVNAKTNNPDAKLTQANMNVIEAQVAENMEDASTFPALFHSLYAVASYDSTLANNGKYTKAVKEFQHRVSLEADGKTDGPFHAMMHFINGNFSGEQFSDMARGGFFINKVGQTLNKHFSKPGVVDLYQTAADKLVERMPVFLGRLEQWGVNFDKTPSKGPAQQFEALQRVMTELGGVELIDGKVVIGRNVLKNPVTITIYGSSANGIASKIAAELLDELALKMSELAAMRKDNPKAQFSDLPGIKEYSGNVGSSLEADIARLTTSSAVVLQKVGEAFVSTKLQKDANNKGKEYVTPNLNAGNAALFEMNSTQIEFLTNNIKSLFVDEMVQVIDEVTHGAMSTMKLLQNGTQLQSYVFRARFKKAVIDLIDDKVADGTLNKGEFLSENDYNRLWVDLGKLGAVVETIDGSNAESQHANASGTVREKIGTYEFSRSFSSQHVGANKFKVPKAAGVGISPQLTISRGDAQVMARYYASQHASLKTVQVFDGLEMAADEIDAVSERINQAVAESIFDNPMRDAADSFADWVRQDPLKGLSDFEIFTIVEESFGSNLDAFKKYISSLNATVDFETQSYAKIVEEGGGNLRTELQLRLESSISEQKTDLEEAARNGEARNAVFERVGWSVDHMASGERSYTHKAPLLPQRTPATIALAMNKMFDEELARIDEELDGKTSEDVQEPANPIFEGKLLAAGTEVEGYDISELDVGSAFQLAMEEAERVDNKSSMDVLNAMRKALPDYRVLVGSEEALTEYRDAKFGDDNSPAIENGMIDPHNGIIYISNASRETVLHEMIHAATAKPVHDYYNNTRDMSEAETNAITNLEELMNQFRELDFSKEEDSVRKSAELVQGEIETKLQKGTQSGALLEFMAWSLSNQNIEALQTKTKARTGLRKLVDGALKGLKRLLGLDGSTQLDMFRNVKWNTGALMAVSGADNVANFRTVSGVMLNQVRGNPLDSRLTRIMGKFETKLGAHLRGMGSNADPEVSGRKGLEARSSEHVSNTAFNRLGSLFTWDDQQTAAFRVIQASMASAMELDGRAVVQAQSMFDHVTKSLSPEDFMKNPEMTGPARQEAERKYEEVIGKYGTEVDRQGRTNLLGSFIALSQVDPDFRAIIESKGLPAKLKVDRSSTDNILTSFAQQQISKLANQATSPNAKAVMDRLADLMATVDEDNRTAYEKYLSTNLDKADGFISGIFSKVGGKLGEYREENMNKEAATRRSTFRETIASSAGAIGGLLDEGTGKIYADSIISNINLNQGNKITKVFRDMMTGIIGITDENRGVIAISTKVKPAIQGLRQDFREVLPDLLEDKFSRKLTEDEFSNTFTVIAKTDAASLNHSRTPSEISAILQKSSNLTSEISKVEESLTGANKVVIDGYKRKAKELAQFMVHGTIDKGNNNRLPNSYQITRLWGEKGSNLTKPTDKLQATIDDLVTLYAIEMVDPTVRESVSELTKSEAGGVNFLILQLSELRLKETLKADAGLGKINGLKGYIPSESAEGSKLVIGDNSESASYRRMGYTKMIPYDGSGFESGKKSYFYSKVAGNANFSQGAMQSVSLAINGVDPITGRNVNGTSAGKLSDEQFLRAKRRIEQGQSPKRGEPLTPVRNESGLVIAYERSMNPDMLALKKPSTQLHDMIGAWAGRQAEEALSQDFNRQTIDELKRVYDKARKDSRGKEFVNLADPNLKDEIWKDAWNMIPTDSKAYIEEIFGEGKFMITPAMMDNAVGYRAPTVAEHWDGASRMSEEHRKGFVQLAELLMGDKAYRNLVTAEKAIQAGVSVAKNTIVVKSFIVPMANLMSDYYQLLALGVPTRTTRRVYKTGLVEIDKYTSNQRRKAQLTAEIAAAKGSKNGPNRKLKLEAELTSIDESNRRLKIWPLIEAGEFSTISEGLTASDAAITDNKWSEYMTNAVEAVPAKLGTAGRYAIVARDTALFKGMDRMIQYGSFLSKAALYEDMVNRQGTTKQEALNRITDEFVNYTMLPSRMRSGAESLGLMWFWNYKIRSIKIAHRMIRDHPLRALIVTGGLPFLPDIPGVAIGSPISDNALNVFMEGRATNAIGPGMLFQAPSLIPWVNLSS
jgi:hypothetical protein